MQSLWLHYTIQFVNSTIDLSRWMDRYLGSRNKGAVRFWHPCRADPFSGQCVDTTSFSGCLSNLSPLFFFFLFQGSSSSLFPFPSLCSFYLFLSCSPLDFICQSQGRVDLKKYEGKVFYNFLSSVSINLTLSTRRESQ